MFMLMEFLISGGKDCISDFLPSYGFDSELSCTFAVPVCSTIEDAKYSKSMSLECELISCVRKSRFFSASEQSSCQSSYECVRGWPKLSIRISRVTLTSRLVMGFSKLFVIAFAYIFQHLSNCLNLRHPPQ